MAGVFLSYRRDDTSAIVGRLYDRLTAHFGKEQVFRDIDAIAPGAEFAKVIDESIALSNVLIAVIGKGWLDARSAEGQLRLDDPNDYVKAEIRAALNQRKVVIPALVEGARVPKRDQLPEDIAALAGRNALDISGDARFDFDVGRLIAAIGNAGVAAKSSSEAKSSPSAAVQPVLAITASQGGIAIASNVVPAPGGGVNIGVGNIAVTQHFTGGDPARTESLARELGVKDTALENFFKILGETKVGSSDLDAKLREIAAKHKALLTRVAEPDGGDAVTQDLKDQARKAIDAGRYDKAESLLNQASDKEAEIGKERLRSAAASKAQNAELKILEFKYAEAARYYQQAHDLLPAGEAALRAGYLNSAGLSFHYGGKYAEAQPLLEDALAIREKVLGPEHPNVAKSLNSLAALYRTQSRYAQAEPLYQRALKILEKVRGAEHPDVAQSLNNLAVLYDAQGRYAQAEPLYQRALKIREKALGAQHPDVAKSLDNLALLYSVQSDYAKAEPLYLRALRILEKALGAEHPYVATALENYALLLDKTDRPQEAAKLTALAQAIRDKHQQANAAGKATP